jgi:hypothetical protein
MIPDSGENFRGAAISEDGNYISAISDWNAASDANIYVSNDSGYTWTTIETGYYWESISMSRDGRYQTAVTSNIGVGSVGLIYVSSDYGVTWGEPTAPRLVWRTVSVSNSGEYQTAGTDNGKIYRSIDYGANWSLSVGGSLTITGITISNDGSTQFASAAEFSYWYGWVFGSVDYGANWSVMPAYVPAFSNGTITIATAAFDTSIQVSYEHRGGGAIVTTDDGWVTKTARHYGNFWGVGASGTGQIMVANRYDSDGIALSSDYGSHWRDISVGGGGGWGMAITNNGSYICFAKGDTLYIGYLYYSIHS